MYNYDSSGYRSKVWDNIKPGAIVAIVLWIVLVIGSCQSEQEKIHHTLLDKINAQKVLTPPVELKQLSYRRIAESGLDSLRLGNYNERFSRNAEFHKSYMELASGYLGLASQSIQLRNLSESADYNKEAAKKKDLAKACKDSMRYYNSKAGDIESNLRADKYPTNYYYLANVALPPSNQKPADTLRLIFDLNFNPIKY